MISACLVIHGQDKLLLRCLESIKDIVDEIVMVHDGKASEQIKLLSRKYKAELYEKEFIGEAERHRPFSYVKAHGDWILQIDADEFLSDKLKAEIKNLAEVKDIGGYHFAWPYFDGKNYIKEGPFSKTMKAVLFRKQKMFMLGIAHEYPRSYGKVMQRPDLQLEHKPESDNYTFVVFKNKWVIWAKLQAQQILNIDQAPVFNITDINNNAVYKYYKDMIGSPIVNGIAESIKFILIYLSRGLLFSGRKSWLIAFLELKYLWLVRLEIRRLKNEK